MRNIIVLCFLSLLSLTGYSVEASAELSAKSAVPLSAQNCKMVETAQLNISFSNVPVTLDTAKTYFDDKIGEIKAIAKDMGMPELEIQNLNYNVYSNNSSSSCSAGQSAQYALNGSVALDAGAADKAADLMKKVGEKGYVVNLNVSSYRQCQ